MKLFEKYYRVSLVQRIFSLPKTLSQYVIVVFLSKIDNKFQLDSHTDHNQQIRLNIWCKLFKIFLHPISIKIRIFKIGQQTHKQTIKRTENAQCGLQR